MPTDVATSNDSPAFQVLLGCALGAVGLYYLLPRPEGRRVALGTFCTIAAFAILATFLLDQFGNPGKDAVERGLFYLFAAGAVGFAAVLVAQRNPARGAIAFAFVVLNVCGLFVLLAAPFLAAATVVVYAGAIIVTFLFVLMLSHVQGHSPENDRSREPLLGSLAGFAFIGLVSFGLYASRPATAEAGEAAGREFPAVPVSVLTGPERAVLEIVAGKLDSAAKEALPSAKSYVDATESARVELAGVTGAVAGRYRFLRRGADQPPPADDALRRVRAVNAKSKAVENALTSPADDARAAVRRLREEVLLLRGSSELPARNVAAVGYLLYSEHLLTVELAGTLLLVATIGAVAIARRKAVPA